MCAELSRYTEDVVRAAGHKSSEMMHRTENTDFTD